MWVRHMNVERDGLSKDPVLEPARDFYALRREGVAHIQALSSAKWTDYNTHDPGITTLEQFSYAMTDLAYRAEWDVKDLLARSGSATPYSEQAFFTARQILTVNPTTQLDWRKTVIDLEAVRNAWITRRQCACETSYYAWCERDQLQLGYEPPTDSSLQSVEKWAQGLYEVRLELEEDGSLGDLNDRKIEQTVVVHDQHGPHPLLLEVRFPEIELIDRQTWNRLLDRAIPLTGSVDVAVGATSHFDLYASLNGAPREAYLQNHWRDALHVHFSFQLDGQPVVIRDAGMRLYGDAVVRASLTTQRLRELLMETSDSGLLARFRQKVQAAFKAVSAAHTRLQAQRNLDEDICAIGVVGIEEVAVCADVEVEPAADIEAVQARIWFEIKQYFDPPIRFRSLKERLEQKAPVEEIFDGPALDGGFIEPADLEESGLRNTLRVSDILDRLMAIPGVIAVNQLALTKYDSFGKVVKGSADPLWDAGSGSFIFDAAKVTAFWLLFLKAQHSPRLYVNGSRFVFYKNGLPFQPRMDEARDTLQQLEGEADRRRDPSAARDLPAPLGVYRNAGQYSAFLNGYPQIYGIGRNGLPSSASNLRKAQAKQFKAYLLVFEQILADAHLQLEHFPELFSLNAGIDRTYFAKLFTDADISAVGEITPALNAGKLAVMAESQGEFLDRRNRVLDHLLARFGEQFSEYALLLTNVEGQKVGARRLIGNKIAFLRRYPKLSHDRGRAFDYRADPFAIDNRPGIQQRLGVLLGLADLGIDWTTGVPAAGQWPVDFTLKGGDGALWLSGRVTVPATFAAGARQKAWRRLLSVLVRPDAYRVEPDGAGFRLKVADPPGTDIAQSPLWTDQGEARAARTGLLEWSANTRMLVVEHLLLRPKFPGDALFPACSEGGCATCGDEDPYSFRLTYVMPGWVGQYADNLDLRGFADRTLRQETPSHLLAKTCWVGNDGFIENPCDQIISDLADLLVSKARTSSDSVPTVAEACEAANLIYAAFSQVFRLWYADRMLEYATADGAAVLVADAFATKPLASNITTPIVLDPLWSRIQQMLTQRFAEIVVRGWQFERFEAAWYSWLECNARFDWTEERLHDRVQALLLDGVDTGAPVPDAGALCDCAEQILRVFGAAFFDWMRGNLASGAAFSAFTSFVPPAVVPSCPGVTFKAGTDALIAQLLAARYDAYREVSYRLWVVVLQLAGLRNVYPAATLHDCDDGSDVNPVRLNNTALGDQPLQRSQN